MKSFRRSLWLWALGGVWVAAVAGGLSVLWSYDNTPGESGQSPAAWPADTRLIRSMSGPTLVLFAHPQCSCTRASLGELAELLARAKTAPKTYVVFLKPFGVEQDWEKTSLWRKAMSIRNVTVVRDDEGMEAARFGAATSGQTVLYSEDGALMFAGGITGARGHSGDNAGRAAVIALLNHAPAERSWSSVFGCGLHSTI